MLIITKRILIKILITILVVVSIFFIRTNIENKTIETSTKLNSEHKILIDVEESKLYVFENDGLIKEYNCSGGKKGTPSPIGTWKIVKKAKWGEGFGGRWLRSKCALGRLWNSWYLKYIINRKT